MTQIEATLVAQPGHLLVVDDNEANRDMLSRRLQRKGHTVQAAADGAQALQMIADHKFDVILLDVMMPGIDGLEVLRRVREDHAPTRLPIIMATARGEREDIVQALAAGANDYITKPLDFPIVVARVQTQLALKRAHDRLEQANRHMKKDLAAAARVQAALLPSAAPEIEGYQFSWMYRPCAELAGDILNITPLSDHEISLYVLDVSGHGVPASLLSVTLNRMLAPVPGHPSLVRRRLDGDRGFEATPPAEVAAQLNRRFQLLETGGQYFTIVYAVLDAPRGLLRFAAAGHPGPIHMLANGDIAHDPVASFPIGWVPDAEYAEQTVQLQPGERIYFYSDGLHEAADTAGTQFGLKRFQAILDECRGATLDASVRNAVDSVHAWSGGTFQDDITMLGIGRDK